MPLTPSQHLADFLVCAIWHKLISEEGEKSHNQTQFWRNLPWQFS